LEKVLIIDTDKCTGCKLCEVSCSMARSSEFNPAKSYIRVLKNKEMDISLVALSPQCSFCNECVKACLPQALEFVSLEEAILKWKGTRFGRIPAPLISLII
jgi:Fe-S-cluster-containing dehydrogenase component